MFLLKRLSLCVLVWCGLLGAGVQAQEFPSKPITLIVPYGSGGTDTQYRKLAELASRSLGQPVIVENKPGANGTLGPVLMAQNAKPDGYTIASGTVSLLRQPYLQNVNWNPLTDFTWIIGLGGYSFAVTVREDSPFKTLADMVKWAKANPGMLTYGTPGQGSSLHLLMEDLASRAGFTATHVPYKGGGETTTAMLGGHVMVGVNNVSSVAAQVAAKTARILTIFDAERLSRYPDVPTAKQLGYNLVYPSAYGLVGPRNMPPAVVKRLHDAFKVAMEDPSKVALLDTLSQISWYRSTEDYTEWAVESSLLERSFLERAGVIKSK